MAWQAEVCDTYRDRHHAGVELARSLARLETSDVVVLALPRGGLPVAFEVSRALDAPLDVLVVRKLGFPTDDEVSEMLRAAPAQQPARARGEAVS